MYSFALFLMNVYYLPHTDQPAVQSVVASKAPINVTLSKKASPNSVRSNAAGTVTAGDVAVGFKLGAALLNGSVRPIAVASA